jgi:hypothetical protein
MFKLSKQKLIILLAAAAGFLLVTNFVLADSGTWTFASGSGLQPTATAIGYSSNPATPEMIISNAIVILLSFLGVAFLGLMIYAGLMWMTAGGNEQTVDRAKKIIEEAVIGLIVVIAAYAISFFVINYFSKNTL